VLQNNNFQLRDHSPKEIYSAILNEIDGLLKSFSVYREENEEIKAARKEALTQLNESRQEIQDSLSHLEKNSEWDVFTIAFYGETNAGKSTLIETLRILLNEPNKQKERDEYARIRNKYSGIEKQKEKHQTSIARFNGDYTAKVVDIDKNLQEIQNLVRKESEEINSEMTGIDDAITKLMNTFDGEMHSILKKIEEINELNIKEYVEESEISETKQRQDVIQLRNIFKEAIHKAAAINSEIKILQDITSSKKRRKHIVSKESDVTHAIHQLHELTRSKEDFRRELKKNIEKDENDLQELSEKEEIYSKQIGKFVDGLIIGDGRSDCTRTVTTYTIEYNNQKFALLDLPGIEGNENLVMEPINEAVQKSHAVFYVTKMPTPPQTGDNNREGTLEKIKKHLGQQTEVFAIYNKPAPNYRLLTEPLIDNADTEKSLQELDRTMRFHIGEQYRQCLTVSAYPAFLAVANCWPNAHETKREKFLEQFKTPETLLEKSHVRSFINRITSDIVNDCKAKIKKSNYKKVAVVICNTATGIRQIHKQFQELQQKLIDTRRNTEEELNQVTRNLKNRIKDESHKAVDAFTHALRRKIYEDIEKGIDNDEFKKAFEKHSNEGIEELRRDSEKKINSVIKKFKEDVDAIMKKYLEYAVELSVVYINSGNFDTKYELNINIKSGVSWGGGLASVAGSVVSVFVCLSNPVGWVVLLSIAGGLLSVVSVVKEFAFNHNYRKSQQKKSVDENIIKMKENIFKSIDGELDKANKKLMSGIEDIKKNELTKPINHIQTFNKVMSDAESKLKGLEYAVKTKGDL
jgi:hypothetical protein